MLLHYSFGIGPYRWTDADGNMDSDYRNYVDYEYEVDPDLETYIVDSYGSPEAAFKYIKNNELEENPNMKKDYPEYYNALTTITTMDNWDDFFSFFYEWNLEDMFLDSDEFYEWAHDYYRDNAEEEFRNTYDGDSE